VADDPLQSARSLEVETIARRKPSPAERARQAAAMLTSAKTLGAYRRVFLRDGELTPDAMLVLEDLAGAAGLGKAFGYGAGADELNAREGKRALLLHLFARLGRHKLQRLAQRMREKSDA
jgi:hypothetical protein